MSIERQNQGSLTSDELPSEQRPFSLPVALGINLLGMLVWPVLAIAFVYQWFDDPTEVALLFGGVTTIFLIPVYLAIPTLSDNVLAVIAATIWLSTWLSLSCLASKGNRPQQWGVTFILSAFSFAQAALGTLMILGKGV